MQSLALINPLPKKSGVTLRATIQNPRPRKYASDADRQKAFRERQAMIQVRVAPKAVETFDEIAETLGYSRQEVVYALLMKGLMSLGNWETVGLPIDWQKKMPQFKLPKYEENPIMRKATPAQLAARERFAEMARSGAFKRKAKAAPKRKKNPAREGIGFEGYDPYASRDRLEEYREKSDAELRYIMKDAGEAARAQRGMTSEAKYLDQVNDAATVLYERKMAREKAIARSTKKIGKREASAINRLLSGRGGNPTEAKERKSRVVLITNPKQRMLNISWLTAGGQREIMKVPIDFVFTHYVGNVAERFFARTENGQLIVSEYSTGGKIGQVPFTMRSAALNDRAAAKRYVGEMLSRIGAERFKAAVKKFDSIN